MISCWVACGCNYSSFGGEIAMLGALGRPWALFCFFTLEIIYVNSASWDPFDTAWVSFWREDVTVEASADMVVPVVAGTCSASAKTTLLSSDI